MYVTYILSGSKKDKESSVGDATSPFVYVHTSFLFQVGMLL